MYCTGVAHFVNSNAWMTFWTHSWPATGNSKPDSPYQPACFRSVTLGLWSVRLCSASASWCWINGWNVRPKLNLCWLQRNVHTKVTLSPWLQFMILFIRLSMIWLKHFDDLATMKMATLAAAAHVCNPKHQSNHRRTKPAACSQVIN